MNAESSSPWGRIDDQGTVYVRTRDGERAVGQWPDGDPAEAMALFTRRFDGLQVEVELLEKRIRNNALGVEEATHAVETVRASIAGANAVGDLDGLAERLETLAPLIEQQRESRKAARAEKLAEASTAKADIADKAERIAQGNDWRGGADQLRAMLEQWKSLPRLDRKLDDELWHRFSGARTTYTRRRKAHFAEQNEKRSQARAAKEQLIKEAESLSTSTEWGPTAGKYRDLMSRWKAAGPAPRGVDDRLWKRFRAAQEVFFSARDAANAELDAEYEGNAVVKRQILEDAEAMLPVTDLDAARVAWRDIAERWDTAGKVPRGQMKELEARIRKVENAIRDAGDARWERTNPEARARADDTVTKLERSITDLRDQRQQAEAAGNARKVTEATEALEAREAWLEQARKALSDFTP